MMQQVLELTATLVIHHPPLITTIAQGVRVFYIHLELVKFRDK